MLTITDLLFVIIVLLITKQEKRLWTGVTLVLWICLFKWNALAGAGVFAAYALVMLIRLPSGKAEHPIGSF